MTKFGYLRDGLFMSACALYAANRWIIKPAWPHSLFGWWFSDALLIPCAAPVSLWIERKIGLRRHDRPPTAGEIFFLFVVWSALFEWIAPHFVVRATGDWRDAIAYAIGGFSAWAWWNRPG